MSDFLAGMARSSQVRADQVCLGTPTQLPVRPLKLRGFDLIAEVKLKAPSVGVLKAPEDPISAVVSQAVAYEAGGAAAISVLTEPERFGGHLDHLTAVARAVDLPVLCKDFLVAPIQVQQARAAGASGVLLILAMLDDMALKACMEVARAAGMFVLLEAFDGSEIDRAAAHLGADVLLGLNCRDLRSLQVDRSRLDVLAGRFPPGAIRVAESGLRVPADAARVAASGYSVALVGTALMQSDDPVQATRAMVAAGRTEEARCASA